MQDKHAAPSEHHTAHTCDASIDIRYRCCNRACSIHSVYNYAAFILRIISHSGIMLILCLLTPVNSLIDQMHRCVVGTC